ncbi:oligosaccharide flippase family protein [Acinetobacter johnsonii]|uniref:oligosaccharide flippase family protein n=1 Tax=Acinetobacter johnsonii TaxID=40214 RepID=UPI0010291984|nr:oligosaccharide flippase family protein [Acinetobacter johnsonii]RZN84960.1 flippase [Acinetobacter johnsonii]
MILSKAKKILKEYKLVIENYFFMTFLQFLNSFFYLAIYPYLILKMGASEYGIYVFSLSVVTFFIYIVNFGFDIPALKLTSENSQNEKIKSKILSEIFFSKIYLAIFSIIVFVILIFNIPVFKTHFEIMLITYIQVLGAVFLPLWYFQALQRMKVLTIIQILVKIITLPFIFIFIQGKSDLWIFALITSFGVLVSSIISFIYVLKVDKVKIVFKKINEVSYMYREALPYFFSNITGVTKEQIIVILLGVFFGMKEVALYDLAMKIVSIPRTIFVSLNTAIFPKLIKSLNRRIIKKIIAFEFLIGFAVILSIVLFGRYVVEFLGDSTMLQSYSLSIILSLTVTVWLVVGCFIYFVFVPNSKGDMVFKNQLVAMLSLLFFLLIGLKFFNDISVFAWAISLSGFCEILFCYYVSKKYRLL